MARRLPRIGTGGTAGPKDEAVAPTHNSDSALANSTPRTDGPWANFTGLQSEGDLSIQVAPTSLQNATLVQATHVSGDLVIEAARGGRTPIPRQLRRPPANFTERDAELADLDARAKETTGALVLAIDGMGGVGKTATALTWAHRHRHSYADGDLYIDLRGYDARDPVDPVAGLSSFVRALGYPKREIPADLDELSSLFSSLVHDRCLLVLLDNAGCAEQVRPFLSEANNVTVLVTSRERLTSTKMGSAVASITLRPFSETQSIKLLASYAGSQRFGREPRVAQELARLCHGLPLALRLVGDRLVGRPLMTLSQLASEIATPSGLVTAGLVHDVFSWSYEALGGLEAEIFRLLGLPTSTEIPAGAAAALREADPQATLDALNTLVNVSLIDEVEAGRFVFHDLLRSFARERAEASEVFEKQSAAIGCYCTWYLNCSMQASNVIMPERKLPTYLGTAPDATNFGSYKDAMDWCEKEREGFVHAVSDAHRFGHPEVAWRMAVAMRGFYNIRKYWSDWELTHRIALESADSKRDLVARAHILNGMGTLFRQTRRPEMAAEAHGEAYEIRRREGDLFGAATALDGLGAALLDSEYYEGASLCFREALAIGRLINSHHKTAWSLSNLGEVELARGNYDLAKVHFCRSLEERLSVQDSWGEGRTRHFLGVSELRQGDYDAAIDQLTATAEFRLGIGDTWGGARSLAARSEAEELGGQVPAALASLGRAAELLESIEDSDSGLLRVRMLELTARARGHEVSTASSAGRYTKEEDE